MVVPSRDQQSVDKEQSKDLDKSTPQKEMAEELSGKLRKDNRDDKLLHSKLNVDKDKIEKAKVLNDAINNNISSFTPDLTFEQMVNNYSSAKKLLGETLIRELTGYEPGYIDKNINIPEFKREIKERIKQNIDNLKKEGLLDKDGFITDEAYDYAALSMLSEELDKLEGKGLLGENESKKKNVYGERQDIRLFRRGDRFKDIELKQTAKKAIRRGHLSITKDELVSSERKAVGKINVIYAIDSSGSMKGEKIKVAKKAGIALAYKAIKNRDSAGLIVFGSKIDKKIEPGKDFFFLAKNMFNIKTSGETDMSLAIDEAIKLFKNSKETNHIIMLTDVLQTKGKKPEKEVLEKTSIAANQKISISIVGINLNQKGEQLAKKICDISKGTLYNVKSLDGVDSIILEDYYRTKNL